MLMHGDREVSTKSLARLMGVKSVAPCAPAIADRHTGYQVGGTSPFGTRRAMPVYMERSIVELPYVYINGGRRGYLVGMVPAELVRVLKPSPCRHRNDEGRLTRRESERCGRPRRGDPLPTTRVFA